MRDLGDLTPIRGVLEWLKDREDGDFVAGDAARALAETRRRLADAIADAERPKLPAEGLTVDEYAAMKGMSVDAVYKRIQRKQLAAKRDGREYRIPVDTAA